MSPECCKQYPHENYEKRMKLSDFLWGKSQAFHLVSGRCTFASKLNLQTGGMQEQEAALD